MAESHLCNYRFGFSNSNLNEKHGDLVCVLCFIVIAIVMMMMMMTVK